MSELPPDWERRAREVDAVAIHANHRHLTPQQAREVKAAGFGLFCYTVNEPARARELLDWGVDAFCTDRIDLIGPDFYPR
jgi:glycerophosphoryl diester phosphodiesterase